MVLVRDAQVERGLLVHDVVHRGGRLVVVRVRGRVVDVAHAAVAGQGRHLHGRMGRGRRHHVLLRVVRVLVLVAVAHDVDWERRVTRELGRSAREERLRVAVVVRGRSQVLRTLLHGHGHHGLLRPVVPAIAWHHVHVGAHEQLSHGLMLLLDHGDGGRRCGRSRGHWG